MGLFAYSECHPNMKYQLAIVLVLAALSSAAPNKRVNDGIANVKNQASEGLGAAQNWMDSIGINFDLKDNLNTLVNAGKEQLNSDDTQAAIQSGVGQVQSVVDTGLNKITDPKLKRQVKGLLNQGRSAAEKGARNVNF